MSYVTDFKSAPFDIFNQTAVPSNYFGTPTLPSNGSVGTGMNGVPDRSNQALLGSKWTTEDGRTLSLVSNAATALVTGVLVQEPAEVVAFEKLAIPAVVAAAVYIPETSPNICEAKPGARPYYQPQPSGNQNR